MKRLFMVMVLSSLGLTATQAQDAPASTATPAPAVKPLDPATMPGGVHPQMAPQAPVAVPDAVKTKFAADYPDVKDANWRKMGNNYEASFRVNNNTGRVMFTADGKLIRSIRQIDASALPKNATDYLAKNNTGQPVKFATEVKDASGKVRYQVMANGKGLSFDSDGNLLNPPAMENKAIPQTPEAPKK